MKLKIQYCTTGRINETKNTYRMEYKTAELIATKIFRSPCGANGAARFRYNYSGLFPAPIDAYSPFDGMISEGINRKLNPKFNPKNYKFIGRVAIV